MKQVSIQWKLYSYCDSTVWFGGSHIKSLDPFISNNYLKRVFPSPSLIMQTTLLHSLSLLSFSSQSESIYTYSCHAQSQVSSDRIFDPGHAISTIHQGCICLDEKNQPHKIGSDHLELHLVLHVHTDPPRFSLRLWLPFHRFPCFHDSWQCHTELLWRTRIELAKQDQRDMCQLLYQWPVTLCGLVWHKTSTAGISACKPSRK